MEKLIHKSSGELVHEDLFKVPGTIVEFVDYRGRACRGLITEVSARKVNPNARPGNSYEQAVYFEMSGRITWAYRHNLRVVDDENN